MSDQSEIAVIDANVEGALDVVVLVDGRVVALVVAKTAQSAREGRAEVVATHLDGGSEEEAANGRQADDLGHETRLAQDHRVALLVERDLGGDEQPIGRVRRVVVQRHVVDRVAFDAHSLAYAHVRQRVVRDLQRRVRSAQFDIPGEVVRRVARLLSLLRFFFRLYSTI